MRRSWTVPLACSLQALVVAAAFLPWVRTGEAERSSFRLLRDLNELGVLQGRLVTAGRVVWVLLPALAAATLLFHALGWRRAGAALGAACALIALGGALAVRQAPVVALAGAQLMLWLSPLALLLSLATAWRPVPAPLRSATS